MIFKYRTWGLEPKIEKVEIESEKINSVVLKGSKFSVPKFSKKLGYFSTFNKAKKELLWVAEANINRIKRDLAEAENLFKEIAALKDGE